MFFFFNDTATTEIYTLSLHDALPISEAQRDRPGDRADRGREDDHPVLGPLRAERHRDQDHHHRGPGGVRDRDRKSTRLNSSHANISYAVFCLKKKKILLLTTFSANIL